MSAVVRVEWCEEEEALLLKALLSVLHEEQDRDEVVSDTSFLLRNLALAKGRKIDSIFRNENGIQFQMRKLEYTFTEGESGLPSNLKWARDIVDTYRNHPAAYEFYCLVGEKTVEEPGFLRNRFLTWLRPIVSGTQFLEFLEVLPAVDTYGLQQEILQYSVMHTVSRKRINRLKKAVLGKVRYAGLFLEYYDFFLQEMTMGREKHTGPT